MDERHIDAAAAAAAERAPLMADLAVAAPQPQQPLMEEIDAGHDPQAQGVLMLGVPGTQVGRHWPMVRFISLSLLAARSPSVFAGIPCRFSKPCLSASWRPICSLAGCP